MAIIAALCAGCHRTAMQTEGSAMLSATNRATVYLLDDGDGKLLGLEIRLANLQPQYIPIQMSSQPAFPGTSIAISYSERLQSIWLQCNSSQFTAEVFYSFKDGKCIDSRYGR